RAHILAMERGRAGETHIIAGMPHTLIDVFDLAERITGIPAPPVPRVARSPPGHRRPVALRAAPRCRGRDLSGEQREGPPGARIRPEASGGWPARDAATRNAFARNRFRGELIRDARNPSNKRCALPAQFSRGDDMPYNEGQSTLFFGPWYRKSPFFEATQRAGAKAYDIYNHM